MKTFAKKFAEGAAFESGKMTAAALKNRISLALSKKATPNLEPNDGSPYDSKFENLYLAYIAGLSGFRLVPVCVVFILRKGTSGKILKSLQRNAIPSHLPARYARWSSDRTNESSLLNDSDGVSGCEADVLHRASPQRRSKWLSVC